MLQESQHSDRRSQTWSCGGPVQVGGASPEVFLPSCGHTQCNGRFRLEQVTRIYAFHVFEEGRGVFELDGKPHAIEPGSMVLLRPGVHARYFDRPESPWLYRWFTLDGARVEPALVDAGLCEDEPVIAGCWHERLADLFSKIENVYSDETVSPMAAIALGWEALSAIGQVIGATEMPANTLASRAQFIIQQEYHRGLQVDELARRLNVSRATLFRQFRAEFGQSPKCHLDDLRLSQAQELLQRGRSSVKEVAYACGFSCAHYFSRAYAKRYGIPPSSARC